jgi:eukaryotic-like serine/threonine-protein kinase
VREDDGADPEGLGGRRAFALLRAVSTTNVWSVVSHAAASANNATPRGGTGPGDRVGTDGRYELLERIGSGGMGAVYRALDHKLGCDRAVKVLDVRYSAMAVFVERFRLEALSASKVAHPNVVSLLDVAEEGERPVFLVMELLKGKTLAQMVKGTARLPWAQVQGYIDQIAAGLGAAHAQGLVHRDVKPGNCLVLPDDQVKVLDFGIAKVLDAGRDLTVPGEIIGTCSYMAPEQIKGQVDKRSDIYALGVLTFRLLTGRVPFVHGEQDKVLLAHLTEPPPRPSSLVAGLPEGVDELVLRMLAKQPHQRFDGMEELRRTLAGIERGSVLAFGEPTASAQAPSRTAMFEDAPTRAVLREVADAEEARPAPPPETATPGSGAKPVKVSLNTAPAGSGTLAQLELEARRMPSTVVLEGSYTPPTGGGTLVVQPELVVPRPEVAMPPPRVMTVPTPVPRPLGNLAASSTAPRVTRFATPGEDGDDGVMRGVGAALGGIALAVVVVTGWVVWKRYAAEDVAPPAAPAAAVVEDPELVEPGVAEGEPPVEPTPSEGAAEGEAAAEGGVAEGGVVEGGVAPEGKAGGGVTVVPEPGEPEVTTPSETSTTDPKTNKKRRKPKTGETKTSGEPTGTTSPEPKPDSSTKKRKPGDLRDPF